VRLAGLGHPESSISARSAAAAIFLADPSCVLHCRAEEGVSLQELVVHSAIEALDKGVLDTALPRAMKCPVEALTLCQASIAQLDSTPPKKSGFLLHDVCRIAHRLRGRRSNSCRRQFSNVLAQGKNQQTNGSAFRLFRGARVHRAVRSIGREKRRQTNVGKVRVGVDAQKVAHEDRNGKPV
jgi:hypothetical protein